MLARWEGAKLSMTVFVYGTFAVSKRTWVKLLKKFVDKNRIQEFNCYQKTIKLGQVENCDLIILQDLNSLSGPLIDVAKTIMS
jgi:hypothetical protein